MIHIFGFKPLLARNNMFEAATVPFRATETLGFAKHLQLIKRDVFSVTCSWINIFVDPGTTLLSTNQIWRTSLSFLWSLGLQSVFVACTSVSLIYNFLRF